MKNLDLKQPEPHFDFSNIRVIVGLGNPGPRYAKTRHNIGFCIVDQFAQAYGAQWSTKGQALEAKIQHSTGEGMIILVKPQTFMNDSGKVFGAFSKAGIKPEQILVCHDELEKKFGANTLKFGGSAKGHNGLKSIIAHIGPDFWRLRFGIDRPANKDHVPDYVLAPFSPSEQGFVPEYIDQAVDLIIK